MLRTLASALALAVCANAGDLWLRRVEPILTEPEKRIYVGLTEEQKQAFQQNFWAGRSIDGAEYFKRLEYADAMFGSGELLSGQNTDRGRVHLAFGAPNRITHLPSSRTFVPLEIWYYDDRQYLFFTRRQGGEPRLYSPALDTIRALLLPTSSNRSLFPVNDHINEHDVRNRLLLSPAEEEALEPAMRVKRGINGLGNDELLGLALSPRESLNRPLRLSVRSKLIAAGEVPSIYVQSSGSRTADIAVRCSARSAVGLQLFSSGVMVDRTETSLPQGKQRPIEYLHRYALPEGQYTVRVECDGRPAQTQIAVGRSVSGPIVGVPGDSSREQAPFTFGGRQVLPSDRPTIAVVESKIDRLRWHLRRGSELVWSGQSESRNGWSAVDLPEGLEGGTYELSAAGQSTRFTMRGGSYTPIVVCYRANLNAEAEALLASRIALAHKDLKRAEAVLASAGSTDEVLTARARIQALSGDLDGARAQLERVLARNPTHSGALAAMGFVSFDFQDYVMAERYFRRALDIEPLPALRAALEQAIAKQKL